MKHLLALSFLLFSFSISQAQTFKVLKIQGKKAIVEINDPELVELNRSYNVGDGTSQAPAGSGTRNHGIDLNFSLSSANSTTTTKLAGVYLWNMKRYEFGPLAEITSGGGVSTTVLGGVGYYNFVENKPGNTLIYAVYGDVKLGSGGGASSTGFGAGGAAKWFGLGGNIGVSLDIGFESTSSTSSGVSSSSSGLGAMAGIIAYY